MFPEGLGGLGALLMGNGEGGGGFKPMGFLQMLAQGLGGLGGAPSAPSAAAPTGAASAPGMGNPAALGAIPLLSMMFRPDRPGRM